MELSVQKIKFTCAHCDHWEVREGNFPKLWLACNYADMGFYWPCPVCTAFMYPEGFTLDVPEPFSINHYNCFSRCPNASECAESENYQPSCEQGMLTPRCLEPIHDMLWAIHTRIQKIEAALLPKKENAASPGAEKP